MDTEPSDDVGLHRVCGTKAKRWFFLYLSDSVAACIYIHNKMCTIKQVW